MSLTRFMSAMAWNGGDEPFENEVVLKVRYRRDVSSSRWWTLEWTGEDGQRHHAESQDFQLMLWRAAEIELRVQERFQREKTRE